MIDYEIRVDDPDTFVRPWTMRMTITTQPDYQIFEYGCHEGNNAMRNALNPVVTVIALEFGTLFSGALITETVFAYPGMGKMIYDAILGNDYNLALVGLLFATLLVLVGNLAADVGYAVLDPRISYK